MKGGDSQGTKLVFHEKFEYQLHHFIKEGEK
jgi:hypothetical protein